MSIVIEMIKLMGINRIRNDELWNGVLTIFEKALEVGGIDHVKIYTVMRALAAINMLDGEVTKGLVTYMIKRGYDAEDFLCMNDINKKNQRRSVHFMMLISYSCPDIKNKYFNNLLVAYLQQVIDLKALNAQQALELYKALRNLKHFKADTLLKMLKNQTF